MNNFFIVIPTFNDWKSLNKLLFSINKNIRGIRGKFRIIVINDNSPEKTKLKIAGLSNIINIKILNLKKNIGSQKAIYVGLKYVEKYNYKSIIAVMDSDGEDDPFKLKKLINLAFQKKNYIFIAYRSKRHEHFFLQFLNRIRLIITFFLTGKYINCGNFSAFSSDNLKKIFFNSNLWFAYSSGILKNCKKIIFIDIEKRNRYYGPSKVKFKFLLDHTIKIVCVFKKEVLIRSFFITSLIIFILKNEDYNVKLIIFFLILNIFSYIYYKINNLNFNCLNLIKNIKNIKGN